jgi:exonuclease VII large subunit
MDEDARLAALLRDLHELTAYLHERGRRSYQLAQRFLEHAQHEQDQHTKAYDENQAKMLDYQHHLWHEIAGLVEKLTQRYGDASADAPPSEE